MRDPLGRSEQVLKAQTGLATARLRCGRRRSDGESRSGLGKGLRTTTTSASGSGRHGGSYRGLVVAGVAAQDCRRRWRAAADGAAHGVWGLGWPSELLDPTSGLAGFL